jgi:glycosyltransferase involved in cell wall biosynthesis
LASGKPILSNIECGFDLLEKYQCGITVQSGSPVELVNGILRFYNMPSEEYERYANNAVKAAKDHVFKAHTDKLEKIIKDLLQ